MEVHLSRSMVALIDPEDWPLVSPSDEETPMAVGELVSQESDTVAGQSLWDFLAASCHFPAPASAATIIPSVPAIIGLVHG